MHPLERLVNLVALLLEARTPLTFEQIRDKLDDGYEHRDPNSAKRMFERDKDVLRDIGVPIDVVATDAWEVEQGYAIAKDRYYLPEIVFTPEEISALFVAARSGGDASAEDAVRKLLSGAEAGILAGLGGSGLGGAMEANLSPAAEAVAGQRCVAFGYRTSKGESSQRTVDALGLAIRGGHWYLVGHDRDRGEIRSFRLSRIAGEIAVLGEGIAPTQGFRAADHVQAGPWGPGEPQTTATVAFSPEVAWWAANGVQGAETGDTRPDGWVEIHVPWQPGESLTGWVLSFGPEAEAVDPPELRADVIARLEAFGAG